MNPLSVVLLFGFAVLTSPATGKSPARRAAAEIAASDAKRHTEAPIYPPMMGWSSWNTYRVNINDSIIRRQADALVATGLNRAGYDYINIDDGFFGWRDSTGVMHTHPERFPDGLKETARYIHDLGLNAGIYSDAGSITCGSMFDHDEAGIGAGLYGHEEVDARLYFNEWGFDYIKIDNCGSTYELALDEEKRYRRIREVFDSLSDRHVRINICAKGYPGAWAPEVAESWRIHTDIRPRWTSVKTIIQRNLYQSAYASPGHFNDMDMLEIGRGLRPEEETSHFGMWCILSSPLMIGCDLTKIPQASLDLLKNDELIAINQDALGRQARVVKKCGEAYVLTKDLSEDRGPATAIALYNPSDTTVRISVDMETLGYEDEIALRDLVVRAETGTVYDSLAYVLAPHASAFFKVTGTRRTEPKRYEAEWAYLPLYCDLKYHEYSKRNKQCHYALDERASCGAVVRFIGGSRENSAIWNDVYSKTGGSYFMTITHTATPHRKLFVRVNDTVREVAFTAEEGRFIESTLPVTLNAGYNLVEMFSPYTWTPDIDKFELKRIGD